MSPSSVSQPLVGSLMSSKKTRSRSPAPPLEAGEGDEPGEGLGGLLGASVPCAVAVGGAVGGSVGARVAVGATVGATVGVDVAAGVVGAGVVTPSDGPDDAAVVGALEASGPTETQPTTRNNAAKV